jgi:D-alanine-D-alanine ligase
MKKQKILVTVHATLIPPDSLKGRSEAEIAEWRTEYDVVSRLKRAGHEVTCVGILDSLAELRSAVQDGKPDIVFNLLEEFAGIVSFDQHLVAYLELLRQPYTGCNPRGLTLSRDKVLSKQILAFHRIPTPQFLVFPRARKLRLPKRLRYPLFVKSATDDASLGIAQASIVSDTASLKERIQFIHEQIGANALVEEYIEGREIYVGALGNERLTVLPPWEMQFGSLAPGQAAIATRKVKWDRRYQHKHGITTTRAADLPEGVPERLKRMTRRIYRALHLSGYARMDFRLRSDGEVYVLEANANPNLAADEDLALSARSAGIGYDELLARVLSLGTAYQAAWRIDDA